MTNYCRNKQVKSTKIRISSWFLLFIGLSWTVTFYWSFHICMIILVYRCWEYSPEWGGYGGLGGMEGQKAHCCLSLLFVSPHPHTLAHHTGYHFHFPTEKKTCSHFLHFLFWPGVCGKRSKFSWWWDVEVSERTDQVGHITSFILFTTS